MRTTKAQLEARNAALEASLQQMTHDLETARHGWKCVDRQLVERTAELRELSVAYDHQDAALRTAYEDNELVAMQRDEARADAERLRTICAEWAHQSKVDARTIARLKAHAPKPARPFAFGTEEFAARCRAYCEQNNVRSVPGDVIREWRNHA